MSFPKGYQLHVTTWENDGDFYQTEILSGLTEADVRFYLDLANRFKSRNQSGKSGMGNGEVTAKQLLELAQDLITKHPGISRSIKLDWIDAIDKVENHDEELDLDCAEMIYTLVTNIIGYPAESIDVMNFCRVFDSFEVYYFPEDVMSVTEKFH